MNSDQTRADQIHASEESYCQAIEQLADLFLEELMKREVDWTPSTDSASALGDELYQLMRERIPEPLRRGLSGGQVMFAAHLAYRKWKGDL
jgi:hypothetical protein